MENFQYKDWHINKATKIRAKVANILFRFGLRSDERKKNAPKIAEIKQKERNIKMKEATSIANEIDRRRESMRQFETSNYSHGVIIGY